MEEKIVLFETAKLAQEKGFNVAITTYYNKGKKPYVTTSCDYQSDRDAISNWNNGQGSYPTLAENVECSAPTQTLLQKWLREVHNIDIEPYLILMEKGNREIEQDFNCKEYTYKLKLKGIQQWTSVRGTKPTYEEALEHGLVEALKLIE